MTNIPKYILQEMRQQRYYDTELVPGFPSQIAYQNGQFRYPKEHELLCYQLKLERTLKAMGQYKLKGIITKSKNPTFQLYDVVDLASNQYMGWLDIDLFARDLGVSTVPLLSYGYKFDLSEPQLEEKAANMPTSMAGIVYRTTQPMWILGHRLEFVLRNPNYKEKNA